MAPLAPYDWPVRTPRLPPIVFDILLAVGVLILGLTSSIEINDASPAPFSREPDIWAALLIVAMAAPLAVRRIYPIPVFAVVVAAWAIDRALDYPASLAQIGVILVFHTVGTELSPRRSLLIGGGAAALVTVWTGLGVIFLESVDEAAIVYQLISTAGPLWLGREVYSRRRHILDLEERAERAERERIEETRRAVAEERARIARELHDVVAHQMTVMTIQADGASRVASKEDPRLTEALAIIKDAGHRGLAEMRRVVGLLRTSDDSTETAPLPRLSDLASLIDHWRSTGMNVRLHIVGHERPLADGTELSAYRIVQESLTNAARHAGPQFTAHVQISYGDEELGILIEDDGRGAGAEPATGTGHGLVGMRERVTVLGGRFVAGPRPGGGFRVEATLPVNP